MREPWVIALASQKGGVGKTTIAVELAAVFADTSGRALVVDIDPQRTAEEIITASDSVPFDFAAENDPRILELDVVGPAALAPEPERDPVAVHIDVPVAQRRQAERPVLACVLVVPDPDRRLVEETDHRRDDPFAAQRVPAHVAVDPPPDAR